MKTKKFVLAFVIFVNYLNTQNEIFTRKIDSVKAILSNKNASDSLAVSREYYVLGELYRKTLTNNDSAYFYYQKAEKLFRQNNLQLEFAQALFGIAVLQTNDKDYTGSEVTSIEAISVLDKLTRTNEVDKYKAYLYNNLGIVFNELGQFDESVRYYQIALDLKKSLEGDFRRSIALSENNLAFAYKNAGLYESAIPIYEKMLADKALIEEYPDVHVLVLGNYANTLYLSNKQEQLPTLYLKALKICDSINDTYNSIIINQHLAEFYNDKNKIDSAKYYAYKAKEMSENYANDDLLKSLLLLSKIEEGEKAAEHLKAYVKLSDSLQKAERKIRNKSARIRFETQQIEQENIRIARERMWLVIISIILLVAGVLIYIIISQRAKNKELKFAKQQQEANEEIYNLMLGEHEKVEEARAIEKQRISQELHDGVLGRLFGTRLSLDSLNMNNSDEAIKTRGQYISELKTIEEDIRKVSHELNTDFISGSGFIDIIKTMVETQTAVYKLNYDLNYNDDINWDAVSNKSKIHIYRILQESLHNIHKHANATYIIISIKLENNVICLTVTDNGSGFDVSKSKAGIGLKNMNARIKEVDGSILVESEKDKGTTVSIKVPTKYL
ncbi:tetratricopeptide repeat-containing sensor histidine kinase [Hyunsoonleella flava]|uniref:Oxygen sensor histidine kinase NreB n=1 Tax=Hyunsoonleella flava TaxID=2527939 RepID=A0A4Q9FIJ1_9FLAO|nr:tetratricopeptide repeat-containing sensor histidine kinase [Hyunsoonleella flava]TBN05302.1 tetratricopeptide repeat-containing sensor histidine kinase [Hyunsoonleella flava]